jgi:prepilin-type N-terminal cleavage/methylation domain-containing protein
MRLRNHSRAALTLIELLVVIFIMGVLIAITALAVSALAPSFKTSNGADLAAGWCVGARQMARRDGVPTGVRFLVGADNMCREAQYVRQPDDTAVGLYLGQGPTAFVARIQTPANVDLRGMVSDGDSLEIYSGGVVRRVTADNTGTVVVVESLGVQVNVFQVNLNPAGVPLPASPNAADLNTNVTPGLTNYRIVRQPQPIAGEANLKLPSGVAIDFSIPSSGGTPTWNGPNRLSTPPLTPGASQVTVPPGPFEIIFSPSGQVVGQGTNPGMIYLWVRRAVAQGNNTNDPDNSIDHLAGKPVIVTVYVRSGTVAQHPVSRKSDPYEYTRDGKASGM